MIIIVTFKIVLNWFHPNPECGLRKNYGVFYSSKAHLPGEANSTKAIKSEHSGKPSKLIDIFQI